MGEVKEEVHALLLLLLLFLLLLLPLLSQLLQPPLCRGAEPPGLAVVMLEGSAAKRAEARLSYAQKSYIRQVAGVYVHQKQLVVVRRSIQRHNLFIVCYGTPPTRCCRYCCFCTTPSRNTGTLSTI